MYDPATGKFTLISTCFPTHHLIFAEDANNTLWTSAGGADQRRGRLAEPQDVRGDRRRGEVARLDAVHPRHQRQRQARRLCRARSAGRSQQGQAGRDEPLQRGCEPGRWLGLGHVVGSPRLRRARRPGSGPDAHRAHRNLRAAVPRLRAARRRHRSQRRLSGRRWRAAISASFDRTQVQRAAQRAERDRQALPRRLDALSIARTAVQGRAGRRQRRGELLHLGGSVRHVRAWARTCRSPPAT